jgi:hypothetical protein
MALLRILPLLIVLAAAPAWAQPGPATEPSPVMSDEANPPVQDSDGVAPESPVGDAEYSAVQEEAGSRNGSEPIDTAIDEQPPIQPEPEPADAPPPTVTAPTTNVVPAAPSVMGRHAPGAVEVGSLGTVEGPVVGTLNDTNGGLGSGTWNGVSRADAEATLTGLGPATSLTVRLLLRKLLLTTAPPPAGQAQAPFNAVRLRALLNAGLINGAAGVAALVRAPRDIEISRAQADALLFAGDDANACGDATAHRMESDEPFWIQLRAYCYALANDPALDLTRAVLGNTDPAFNALMSGVISGKPRANVAFANPTSLHVRMMVRLKLPLTREVIELRTPGAFIVAQSAATPKPVRMAAAEEALRAGALPPATLAQVLDFIAFKPADLTAAATMARSDALMMGLARLRAALKRETNPVERAELVFTAFRIGEEHRLLHQVAPVFADAAIGVTPQDRWSNWAPTMIRGLAATGRMQAADNWLRVVTPGGDAAIILALTHQDQVHAAAAQQALANLATETVVSADAAGPRAVLYFGLFDALAMPLPPDAQTRVAPLMVREWPGRRPPAATLKRIDDAALRQRRGEVVLNVIAVLGQGPGDLAPDVTVRLVRALQTAGVTDGAHALAAEAALAR